MGQQLEGSEVESKKIFFGVVLIFKMGDIKVCVLCYGLYPV